MLHKLGLRLTLLNLFVSGAILLVMALVVLGVTEANITDTYEEDLKSLSSAMLSMLRNTEGEASDSLMVQTSGEYLAALQTAEEAPRPLSLSTDGKNQDTVSVLTKAASLVQDRSDSYFTSASISIDEAAQQTYTLFSVPVVVQINPAQAFEPALPPAQSYSIHSGNTAPSKSVSITVSGTEDSERAMQAGQAQTYYIQTGQNGDLLATLDGQPYRILATRISLLQNEAAGEVPPVQETLLLLQNRTQELRALQAQRWLFGGLVLGGLLLILLASRFLSRRAISPIEVSLRQQREFVADASHELRTPIAAIRANAEVLEDAPLPDTFAPYLSSIASEGERMTRLVGDLLDLARADAGELSLRAAPVDVAQTAREALRLVRPLAEKQGLQTQGQLQSLWIEGDRERLLQALLALLDNAIRYTPAGGSISLCAQEENRWVVLLVADTGIGIDPAHKNRVFDRFYRTDAARSRAQGGAGLGLSVARQVVEQMRGTLSVRDNPGGGSVFEMRFPRMPPPEGTKF